MGFTEIETSPPLEAITVDRYRLRVSHDGERYRRVAAFVIESANDSGSAIYLGKGVEAGFISGGEAVNRLNGAIVLVEPADIAIHPHGNQLRVYKLPE